MKVLIFTVTAGNGHNSAANNLKGKFEEKGAEVKIVDVYNTYTSKLRAWFINEGYLICASRLVGLYNYVFRKLEKKKPENCNKNSDNQNAHVISYPIMKEIYDYKPDLVITTHFTVAAALTNISKVYNLPPKTMSLALDYGISPYWECCTKMDYMFLTGDYMKQGFIDRGFKNQQLYATGIPVKDLFSKELDKKQARKAVGFDENLFTLIIMKLGFFSISDAKLMKQVSQIKQPIQVVVSNGKDQKAIRRWDKLIKVAKGNGVPHTFHNIGFVPGKIGEMLSASDLILGKAGGLTVTETVTKALPSLIVHHLPQQEIYNREYLISNNCAQRVNKKGEFSAQLEDLINNPEKLVQMQENCKKVRKLFVLDSIYDILKTVPTAAYSDTDVSDSKKTTIRKIKQALKSSHRRIKNERKTNTKNN